MYGDCVEKTNMAYNIIIYSLIPFPPIVHIIILYILQPSLSTLHKLSTSARDRRLSSVHNSGLEDDGVSFLPQLRLESLAGDHHTSKADLEVLVLAELAKDVLARNTQRAQTVQDGGLEATDLAELGIDVQRVAVTVQAVQGSLVLRGFLLNDGIGLALGSLVRVGGRLGARGNGLGRATEATTATDEDGRLIVEDVLARLSVLGGVAGNNKGSVALVNDINELGVGQGVGSSGDGPLPDFHVLLTVQQHHGREVLHNVFHVVRSGSVEPRDHSKAGKSLEVLVVLVDQRKVSTPGTQAQVVQDDITVSVVKGRSVSGHLLGLLNVLQDVALALVSAITTVAHVCHDLLSTSLAILGVVSTAVVEVGNLLPLLDDLLGGELDVHGESVAASALPAGGREPAATALVQTLGASARYHVGAKEDNQGSDVVGLEGLDHLLRHDGSGHISTGVGGNGVDLDVVLGTLESQGTRESKNTKFLQLSARHLEIREAKRHTAAA